MTSPVDVPDDVTELTGPLDPDDPGQQIAPRPRRESVQWHWLRVHLAAPELPAALKRTGVVHATYADSDGTNVRPSIPTLARELGKHGKRVSADRRRLRELEWLTLVGEHSTADGICDEYALGVPWTSTVPDKAPRKVRARAWNAPQNGLTAEAEDEKTRARETRSTGWKSAWLRAVVRCPAFTDPEVLVAAALAIEATSTGVEVHPGWKGLADATGLGRRAVLEALAGLRESRAVTRLFEGSSDGRGLHDEYILTDLDTSWLAARLRDRAEAKEALSSARKSAAPVGPRARAGADRPGAPDVPEPGAPDVPDQVRQMFRPGAPDVPTRCAACSEPGARDVRTRCARCGPTALGDRAGITTLGDRVESPPVTSAQPAVGATTQTEAAAATETEQAAAVMGRCLGADWFATVMADLPAGTPPADVAVTAYRLARTRGHLP